jgi:2-keto-myo-inositol isomerase
VKPAISQVCSLPSAFAADVEDYAAGKCSAIEVWLTKLEDYLAGASPEALRQLLDQHQMTIPVASYQGGLLASQGDARREAWSLFERRLTTCRELGIGTLVLAADIPPPLNQALVERVHVSVKQAADAAAEQGVKLALEFQAGSVYLNNLQTAVALVTEMQHAHLGLCLDAFHWYVGPSKLEDLGYLTAETLFHVQLCDIADVPREFATDSHRILPGEGDIPVAAIVHHLRHIGYAGHLSLEIMNPQLWQVPPLQFGEIAMTALRRLLGQSAMS